MMDREAERLIFYHRAVNCFSSFQISTLYDSHIFTQHPLTSHPGYLFSPVCQQSVDRYVSLDKICGNNKRVRIIFCWK